MKKNILIVILILVAVLSKAQTGPVSSDVLDKYPTFRKLKAPPDSVYKMTLENLGPIPGDFDKFNKMQVLCIFGNDWDYDLYSLPAYFYNFPNLTYLSLGNTDIGSLGPGIKNLTYLKTLNVADNRLIALPRTISLMEELQNLTIDNNIAEIPEIPTLVDLTILCQTNIGDDSGSIPEGIPALVKLRTLTVNSENTFIDIPSMIQIIKSLPVLERLSFIDPNLTEGDLKALSGIKKIKELNLPSIEASPESMAGFSFLKKLSFGEYLENDPAKREKFWKTILSFKDLEEVTVNFYMGDTAYYKQLKKLNVMLNLSNSFADQLTALQNMPSLYSVNLPQSASIPRALENMKTMKEIDVTGLYGLDFSIVFGYLMMVPSLEKIIVSNDQFTVFPPETSKLVHIKEMEIYNIQHGSFGPISEKEKARAQKLLPNCKFTYIEYF
jgi:Leucine-rich repeat (LRR) protein